MSMLNPSAYICALSRPDVLNSLHSGTPKQIRLPSPPQTIPPLIRPALVKEHGTWITVEVGFAVEQEQGEAEEVEEEGACAGKGEVGSEEAP